MKISPLLILLLSGCGSSDGYEFQTKEFERLEPSVSFVVHPSTEDLRRAGPSVGEDRELMAWAKIKDGGCEVHIVDPQVSYRPEWVGHEVIHCIYGRWHR